MTESSRSSKNPNTHAKSSCRLLAVSTGHLITGIGFSCELIVAALALGLKLLLLLLTWMHLLLPVVSSTVIQLLTCGSLTCILKLCDGNWKGWFVTG